MSSGGEQNYSEISCKELTYNDDESCRREKCSPGHIPEGMLQFVYLARRGTKDVQFHVV